MRKAIHLSDVSFSQSSVTNSIPDDTYYNQFHKRAPPPRCCSPTPPSSSALDYDEACFYDDRKYELPVDTSKRSRELSRQLESSSEDGEGKSLSSVSSERSFLNEQRIRAMTENVDYLHTHLLLEGNSNKMTAGKKNTFGAKKLKESKTNENQYVMSPYDKATKENVPAGYPSPKPLCPPHAERVPRHAKQEGSPSRPAAMTTGVTAPMYQRLGLQERECCLQEINESLDELKDLLPQRVERRHSAASGSSGFHHRPGTASSSQASEATSLSPAVQGARIHALCVKLDTLAKIVRKQEKAIRKAAQSGRGEESSEVYQALFYEILQKVSRLSDALEMAKQQNHDHQRQEAKAQLTSPSQVPQRAAYDESFGVESAEGRRPYSMGYAELYELERSHQEEKPQPTVQLLQEQHTHTVMDTMELLTGALMKISDRVEYQQEVINGLMELQRVQLANDEVRQEEEQQYREEMSGILETSRQMLRKADSFNDDEGDVFTESSEAEEDEVEVPEWDTTVTSLEDEDDEREKMERRIRTPQVPLEVMLENVHALASHTAPRGMSLPPTTHRTTRNDFSSSPASKLAVNVGGGGSTLPHRSTWLNNNQSHQFDEKVMEFSSAQKYPSTKNTTAAKIKRSGEEQEEIGDEVSKSLFSFEMGSRSSSGSSETTSAYSSVHKQQYVSPNRYLLADQYLGDYLKPQTNVEAHKNKKSHHHEKQKEIERQFAKIQLENASLKAQLEKALTQKDRWRREYEEIQQDRSFRHMVSPIAQR